MVNQMKRTRDAIARRCAESKAEHFKQQNNKKRPIEDTGRVISSVESLSADKAVKKTCPSASSRKGNISFRGYTTPRDVKVNEPAYLELSHAVCENLPPTSFKISDGKTSVDRILHELFLHGDSAQKYTQGSKSMKIDNFILLDNFVPKSEMSRSCIQALRSHSKRSKKHMSRKQHKKCGSLGLRQNFCKFEIFKPMHEKWKSYIHKLLESIRENSQFDQCFLNADLHGAVILVVVCKIVSYRGIRGIIVWETKETFGVITDNNFQVVPKKPSVFLFQAGRWKIIFHGDKLTNRNLVL